MCSGLLVLAGVVALLAPAVSPRCATALRPCGVCSAVVALARLRLGGVGSSWPLPCGRALVCLALATFVGPWVLVTLVCGPVVWVCLPLAASPQCALPITTLLDLFGFGYPCVFWLAVLACHARLAHCGLASVCLPLAALVVLLVRVTLAQWLVCACLLCATCPAAHGGLVSGLPLES